MADAYYMMALNQAKLDEGKITIEIEANELPLLPFTPSYEAYKEAALKSCPTAAYHVGLCFLNGIGVQENDQMAVLYFALALAAGSIDALTALGNCYVHGYGVEQDPKKALDFYQKAVDGGSVEAKCHLGILWYTEGKKDEGFKLIEEAAKSGYSKANEVLKALNKPTPKNQKDCQAIHPVMESKIDESFFPYFNLEQTYRFMTHRDESQKEVTLQKAIDYINEGRLFDLQSNDDGTRFAVKVHGSNGNIYETELWFSDDKSQITEYHPKLSSTHTHRC